MALSSEKNTNLFTLILQILLNQRAAQLHSAHTIPAENNCYLIQRY
jgi:hypothetical protein